MRNLFFYLSVLICSSAFGQDVTAIRKTVEQINRTGNYTVKTVPNEYFVEKGQVTDNGSELKGFYYKGELQKMGYSVSVSAWRYLTEYFFDRGQPVFVHYKKYRISGGSGLLNQPVLVSESRYYYVNGKLIKTTGVSGKDEEKKDHPKEAAVLKKDLENYQ
ncbi:hypothetical protein FY557_11985 [Chryseobacterium sp. SN22]|uniref:hypothetical protein n=1 Tax=Chryseobacterium sp. SN22 TaxID=2606431 RepID=UPI0011F069C5|nr:hypothetical protein [Chryseobacterium sp. SN22]KAA0127600.1 hypothetical protein FY557_11985 [Chryseobacterium sp. SN22]